MTLRIRFITHRIIAHVFLLSSCQTFQDTFLPYPIYVKHRVICNTTSIQATGTTSPAVVEECSSRSASQPVGHTLITIRCTMDNRLFLVVAGRSF
jgi:hypothetical protein